MRIFKGLDDAGQLNAWIATCIATDSILTPERDGIGAPVIKSRGVYRSEHIAVDYVKFFMDGVPGARTAAFHRPYVPGPDGVARTANSLHSVSELGDLIRPLDREGIHVKVHAVGDRAIHDTLDAVENVRSTNGWSGPQHSIAHLGYISDDDIARLKPLNVLADLCPPLWYPNAILANNATVLGGDRNDKAWPIADIVRSGAAVAVGTDWPIVESPNPWPGVASLITRKDPTGAFPGQFRPEQAISLEEALPLCTLNVAQSMGIGRITGSITPGKCADFILLDRDIFSIAAGDIAETQVLRTYFSGRLIHSSDVAQSRRPA